jgi:NAD(P)-dependent dehydrogenase (short-subunit alcohol dehydrogenase family)
MRSVSKFPGALLSSRLFAIECGHHCQSAFKDIEEVVLLMGVSSGFGAFAALALAKAGHIVYASMRDSHKKNTAGLRGLEAFATENRVSLRDVELDVTSQESADAAVANVRKTQGLMSSSTTLVT